MHQANHENLRSIFGSRATIIGLAREGAALARFLVTQGMTVTVSDIKNACTPLGGACTPLGGKSALQDTIATLADLPIRYVLGGHPPEILETDVLFVSPGVPIDIPILRQARARGIPISSETRLFCELCPAPIIGITGSSGKTTTTTLVGEMLRTSGYATLVGGNIGNPLIGRMAEITPNTKVVMELSSFQLEYFAQVRGTFRSASHLEGISPHIAAILNITPNHLDRHLTMDAYIAAKMNILNYQRADDVAILSYDNPVTRSVGAQRAQQRAQHAAPLRHVLWFSRETEIEEGAFLRDGAVVLALQGAWHFPPCGDKLQCHAPAPAEICRVDEIKLRGAHNVANVLAACAIAGAAGATPEAMRAVATTFTSVEHRLELVAEIDGAAYYNDSIATTPERAVAALRSFTEPIVLLAGGRDKHLPMDEFAGLIHQKVKHLILFGEMANLVEQAVINFREPSRLSIYHASTLDNAVAIAAQVAQAGDVVLLSPAGTSYDAFRDFAERGARFRMLVRELETM